MVSRRAVKWRIWLMVSAVVLQLSTHGAMAQEGIALSFKLGEPSGIDVLGDLEGVGFFGGAGWSNKDGGGPEGHFGLHFYPSWQKTDESGIGWYFGGGVRVAFLDETRWGLVAPVGLLLGFKSEKLRNQAIYLEVEPVFDVTPSGVLSLNGGIGYRVYL